MSASSCADAPNAKDAGPMAGSAWERVKSVPIVSPEFNRMAVSTDGALLAAYTRSCSGIRLHPRSNRIALLHLSSEQRWMYVDTKGAISGVVVLRNGVMYSSTGCAGRPALPSLSGRVSEWQVSGAEAQGNRGRMWQWYLNGVDSMALSQERRLLAIGTQGVPALSYDPGTDRERHNVAVVDLDAGEVARFIRSGRGPIRSMWFVRNGSILVTHGESLRFWAAPGFTEIKSNGRPRRLTGEQGSVAISENGRTLAVIAKAGNQIDITNCQIGDNPASVRFLAERSVQFPGAEVTSVQLAPDGTFLTASLDIHRYGGKPSVRVVDTRTGETVLSVPSNGAVAFIKGGRVAIGTVDGGVEIWGQASTPGITVE